MVAQIATLEPRRLSLKEQQQRLREDVILQAVNGLLAEKGFDLMTVDEVAAVVGIAKASLYKHFPSKEALAASAMEQALDLALQQARLERPRVPVISNVDARPHDDPEEIRQLLANQVTQPVLWEDSLRWMLDGGVSEFYEVGPGSVLRGLLKRIQRKIPCHGVLDS